MSYRGPNESSVWNDENIILGHRRLSIIGLSNGSQPIWNEDQSKVIVCNGEIYNHIGLRRTLESCGHSFSTQSDCEVILHAYEEYGSACLNMLEGMFAFIIYDLNCKTLVAARDQSGKKPLYITKLPNGVVLSSELKTIKNHFLKNHSINFEIIRQTQKYSYSISEAETYITNISKVRPGHYIKIALDNSVEEKTYTSREIRPRFTGTYEEACKKVKELTFEAVEKRLMSEVKLGMLLSAGVDSSIIACVTKELGHDITALIAGYSGNHTVDERIEAKRLCFDKNIKFEEIELSQDDFSKNYTDLLPFLDEPVADPSMFPQWSIYRASKKLGYTTLLSGNGADELFYGYEKHNIHAETLEWLSQIKNLFPAYGRKHFLKTIFKILFSKSTYKNAAQINNIGTHPVLEELSNNTIQLESDDWFRTNQPYYIDRVYHFLKYAWLPNNCYFLSDKLGMAHSVEIRCPFSDEKLIQYINSLPIEYKYPNKRSKGLLKDAFQGVVPNYVLDRSKTGFTPPKSFLDDIISRHTTKNFNVAASTLSQVVTDDLLTY